jgi:hypothetical protein
MFNENNNYYVITNQLGRSPSLRAPHQIVFNDNIIVIINGRTQSVSMAVTTRSLYPAGDPGRGMRIR